MNGSTTNTKKKGKKKVNMKNKKFDAESNEVKIFKIKMQYQFLLAITFFMIFFTILMYTIFIYQDESESVISIAGIFSAWMGAIIAFYFMEHRTSETVFTVKQSEEEIRQRLKSLDEMTTKNDEAWDQEMKKLEATVFNQESYINQLIEERDELSRKLTKVIQPSGPIGEVITKNEPEVPE